MRLLITIVSLFICSSSLAQRSNNWAFGDSVGINFNTVPPTVDTTIIIMSREPAASISDLNGNLLFYVGTPSVDILPGYMQYVVRNAVDSIMTGVNNFPGHTSITQGLIIIPNPYDSAKYYIFYLGGIGILYYSVVDITLNNGLGKVVSANNILYNATISEKMNAVKAANGKDWWLIGMEVQNSFTTDYFYKFKIDSSGITFKGTQLIGTPNVPSVGGQMIFSPDGTKLVYTGGKMESMIIDFDRCTGTFSNPQLTCPWWQNSCQANEVKYGASFSPSSRYAYLSVMDTLWQFDTQAATIANSKQQIYIDTVQYFAMGQQMLGPDGKIYIANAYKYTSPLPYDSMRNGSLSVIESPDSAGSSCNFAPYSFFLNGRKSLAGLPNMPNYNLGMLEDVNCDSIIGTGINNSGEDYHFNLYPNPTTDIFNVEFYGEHFNSLELYSLEGQLLTKTIIQSNTKYLSVDISKYARGVYLVKLTDHSNRSFVRKLIHD